MMTDRLTVKVNYILNATKNRNFYWYDYQQNFENWTKITKEICEKSKKFLSSHLQIQLSLRMTGYIILIPLSIKSLKIISKHQRYGEKFDRYKIAKKKLL